MAVREVIKGYTILSEWRNGQRGRTAKAEKGGKKYFIKKYTNFVLPARDGTFDAKTIRLKEEQFNSFVDIRKKVINAIKPAAGPGGNIIIPCDNFVYDLHYYEVTEFINGVIPDEELESFIQSLGEEDKLLMMKTAAGALSAVHSAKIIHSDIKLKNIMVVKNSASNFVAKLVDFDSSYPCDDRKHLGGDDAYCSPELALYANSEDDDEREELLKNITGKTDIFSLGVVYHNYLSGERLEAVELTDGMKRIKSAKEKAGKEAIFYPAVILLNGCELALSDKIKSPKMRLLLMDMLNKDPEKRPTAMQVLQRLKAPEVGFEEPWAEHSIKLVESKLSAGKVIQLTKKAVGSEQKYELAFGDGTRVEYTKEELVSKGYAKNIGPAFEDPWPEHAIEYDKDKLKERGFVGVGRATLCGKNGYRLFRAGDDRGVFNTKENMVFIGFAKKIGETAPPTRTMPPVRPVTPSPSAEEITVFEPWPEHGVAFDNDAIKAKGFTKAGQKIANGVKGYGFVKPDGTVRFMRVEMALVQKLVKKV